MSLKASRHYIWSTEKTLGEGATAAVYEGFDKTNGKPVAVKVFKRSSYGRPYDIQMREFEVLKKVKHENIVKLLAVEEEELARANVIVMELCTGGSLLHNLTDPENAHGLKEDDFLLVLRHLSAGMKYLHDNSLVHRDLKPGNIMRFVCDDGSTIYKLIDFGTARELHEGQQFASLHGTEEYLHPDMYERAVLGKPTGKRFGTTVDLWSTGVTMYHVATGSLPFRPYGRRKDRETMYRITTTKADGVISGVQTVERGPIEWSRELPADCELSAGLKKIVTPLIAGLLEADSKRTWTFDKFFAYVLDVLSCKVVNVFHVNSASEMKVYIRPHEKYDRLETYLAQQTKILPDNQILLFEDALFANAVGRNTAALNYPSVSEAEPLILFHKKNNSVTVLQDTDLPAVPEFTTPVSLENDVDQASIACKIGHTCKRRIEKASSACTLIDRAVNNLSKHIKNELRSLNFRCLHLRRCLEAYADSAEMFKLECDLVKSSRDHLNYVDSMERIHSFLSESSQKVEELHQSIVCDGALYTKWETSSRLVKKPTESRATARAARLVERLRNSWQLYVTNHTAGHLSHNDETFHKLERIKIAEALRTLKILLQSDCIPALTQAAGHLGDWYKIAQTTYLQAAVLKKEIVRCEKALTKLLGTVKKSTNHCRNSTSSQIKNGLEGLDQDQMKILLSGLTLARDLNKDMWKSAAESVDLLNKVEKLIVGMEEWAIVGDG